MTHSPDFRALCAELLKAWDSEPPYDDSVASHDAVVELLERARALLAAPEAVGVADDSDVIRALVKAEAALADIGDADREPGDDLAWCERRAAEALPFVRDILAIATKLEAQP